MSICAQVCEYILEDICEHLSVCIGSMYLLCEYISMLIILCMCA